MDNDNSNLQNNQNNNSMPNSQSLDGIKANGGSDFPSNIALPRDRRPQAQEAPQQSNQMSDNSMGGYNNSAYGNDQNTVNNADQGMQDSFNTMSPQQNNMPVSPVVSNGGNKGSAKKILTIFLILILVALLAGLGYWVYTNQTKKKKPSAPQSTIQKAASAPVNKWTGAAANLKWSDPKNWSMGLPQASQVVEIDVSQLSASNGQISLNNDIKDLVVNQIKIDGASSGLALTITGNPVTVNKGISDLATKAAAAASSNNNSSNSSSTSSSSTPAPAANSTTNNSGTLSVIINAPIVLAGDQIISVSGINSLTFGSGAASQSMSIGTSKVAFKTEGTAMVSIAEPITGSGTIGFEDGAISSTSSVMFSASSTNFTGSVNIGMDDIVSLNAATTANNAFGTAKISVSKGGALMLKATGANAITLMNALSLAGDGVKSSGAMLGATSGALVACITITGQQGCSAGVTVNLTGAVSLSENTKLGAMLGSAAGSKPTSATTTYHFANLTKGSYTITPVDTSSAVIN